MAVIVIHEIWSLNDNIIDVSRRVANEGYSALAPHLYSKYDSLTPENIQSVMSKVWSIVELLVTNREKFEGEMMEGLIKSYDYLVKQGFRKIVGMGFCMGGDWPSN